MGEVKEQGHRTPKVGGCGMLKTGTEFTWFRRRVSVLAGTVPSTPRLGGKSGSARHLAAACRRGAQRVY